MNQRAFAEGVAVCCRALLRSLVLGCVLYATAKAQPNIPTQQEWRIDGEREGLITVSWLLPLSDGGIAIAQLRDRAVRFFDSAGRPVGGFGRAGSGPGEFSGMGYGGVVGDSIWIFDSIARRLTLVTPHRTLLRTVGVGGVQPSAAMTGRYPATQTSIVRAVYGDGSYLVSTAIGPGGGGADFDTAGRHLFRVSDTGTIQRYIGHLESPITIEGRAIPFASQPRDAVSANGSFIAMLKVADVTPNASAMRLTLLSATGDTVYSRSLPFDAVPIPRRVADSALAAVVAAVGQGRASRAGDRAAAIRRDMRLPPVYPPYAGLDVSDDGTVWVQLARTAASSSRRYLVVTPRGGVAGIVTTPSNTNIITIGRGSAAWAIATDTYGVPSVISYRVMYPRTGTEANNDAGAGPHMFSVRDKYSGIIDEQ